MKLAFIVAGLIVFSLSIESSAQVGLSRAAGDCDLDFDRSARVTVQDYAVFIGAFGTKFREVGFDNHADRDNNGAVTALDWGLMLSECPLSNK